MPGRKSAAPRGIPKQQYEEQKARQIPEDYGSDYGGKVDLHPARYPQAISHDSVFHDRLYEHISNLRSRIDGALSSPKVSAAKKSVTSHLDKAESELNRSFAAHKAGFEDGVTAFHTANEAYVKAHQHLTNAHRELVSRLGLSSSALRKIGGEDASLPLLTSAQRSGLVQDYAGHIRGAVEKRKGAVPEGVVPQKRDLDLSDIGEVAKVGNSSTPSYKRVKPTGARAAQEKLSGMRERATQGGRTFTVAEAQRAATAAAEGQRAPKPKNAYSGVGVTGFNTVATAAKIHFEYNNPGESWFNSPESKDPVGYAAKNKVGLPSQEAMVSKFTRLMGFTAGAKGGDKKNSVADTTAGKIASGEYTEEPVMKNAKSNRTGEFNTGGNK